jgi:two-component system, cell cycle response regulator
MAGFAVVMCGISGKDARMVEIVVSRAPNLKYQYQLVQASNAVQCDIALVDAQAPTAALELATLRQRFGNIATVFISDDGSRGDSAYKIARRSLLLHILRTLDDISAQKLKGALAATPAPVAPSATGAVTAQPPVPANAAPPKKLEALAALVVDDSLTVRTQLQGALDRIGIKGVLAENGQVALDEVQKKRFDIILLDVVMPGMDGYALCRQIKSAPTTRGTPVVMLTSRSSPFDRARGALAGCDTYLTKPIDLKSFYRAVDKVLMKAFKDDRNLMTERGYRLLAL